MAFLMIFWLVSQLMLFYSLYDEPLLSNFLSFLFSTIPRFPMTSYPTGSCLKSNMWQSQMKFVVPISKSGSGFISVLEIKNACYGFCIGVANSRVNNRITVVIVCVCICLLPRWLLYTSFVCPK